MTTVARIDALDPGTVGVASGTERELGGVASGLEARPSRG